MVAAATPGGGVALTAARSPPLAEPARTPPAAESARTECGGGAGERVSRPRRCRGGGGSGGSTPGGGARGSSALNPPTRGPAEARGEGVPSVPGGSRLLRRFPQIASGQSEPGLRQHELRDRGAAASRRRREDLCAATSSSVALLPPFPPSPPHSAAERSWPRPPPFLPAPRAARQWAGTQATADQLGPAPSPSRLEKGRTGRASARTPIADARAPTAPPPARGCRPLAFLSSELAGGARTGGSREMLQGCWADYPAALECGRCWSR